MKLRRTLLSTLLLAVSQVAFACADPSEPSFLQQLAAAKTVAVVRLQSLQLASSAPGSRTITGKIEIIRTLKGKPTFHRIIYSDVPCGGLLPVVGRYYLIATRDTGTALKFVRGDNSIIDVSSDYALTYPPPPEKSKVQWHIANYLRGVPLPSRLAERLEWFNIHGTPPPPPPRPVDAGGGV